MSRTKSHDSETGVKNSQNGLVSEFSTRKDSPKAGKQIQQGVEKVKTGFGVGQVRVPYTGRRLKIRQTIQ